MDGGTQIFTEQSVSGHTFGAGDPAKTDSGRAEQGTVPLFDPVAESNVYNDNANLLQLSDIISTGY